MDQTPKPQPAPEPARAATAFTPIPGGFWLRGGAYMIDGLLLAVPSLIAIVLLPAPLRPIAQLIVPLTYFTVVPVLWDGRTLGKVAAGLAIVREDGAPLGYLAAFLRWLGYLVNTFTLCIGFIVAAFTENKRGLHDYIAGTRVLQVEEIGLGRKICVIGFAFALPLAAILGMAAAVAIARFARLQSLSKEAAAKARLGSLRSAAAIYYGDHDGKYPPDLATLPEAAQSPSVPECPAAAGVENYDAQVCTGSKSLENQIDGARLRGTGKWGYVADPKAPCYGQVFIDCKTADSKGKAWYSY